MAIFEYDTRLNCSPESLFDFLSRPENISRVTSPDLGISFNSAPEVVHAGAQLDFQVITFGQIVRSVHEIVEFERPQRMVERQISGPMKLWQHRHEYQPIPEGVLKRDIVEFQLPGGLLGLLLSDAKVCSHLEDGFYYREQRLNDLIAQGVLG